MITYCYAYLIYQFSEDHSNLLYLNLLMSPCIDKYIYYKVAEILKQKTTTILKFKIQ